MAYATTDMVEAEAKARADADVAEADLRLKGDQALQDGLNAEAGERRSTVGNLANYVAGLERRIEALEKK